MKQILIFVGFVLLLTTSSLGIRGQKNSVALKDKRVTIQMDKKPIFDVFIRLIYDYDVAIGFEESTLDRKHDDYQFPTNIPYDEINTPNPDGSKKSISALRPVIKNHLITVNFKDAILKNVLNEIVKQMRNYRWEITDNVVNIIPTRGRDPKMSKLLDLKISKFDIFKNAEVGMIRTIIFHLPEFKAFLSENDLHVNSLQINPWFNGRPLPEMINFSDKRFKELLNAITKSKRGGWILQENKNVKMEGKELIDVLI